LGRFLSGFLADFRRVCALTTPTVDSPTISIDVAPICPNPGRIRVGDGLGGCMADKLVALSYISSRLNPMKNSALVTKPKLQLAGI
jgi:hypothetical protein